MIGDSTDLKIRTQDNWEPRELCCTKDPDALFHTGGTIGDCDDHCVLISTNRMTLTVEIKNELGEGANYFVGVTPVGGEDSGLLIESPGYESEPIPYDKSKQFKFCISQSSDFPDSSSGSTINLQVVVKYAGNAEDYQINTIDADLRLEPSVKT